MFSYQFLITQIWVKEESFFVNPLSAFSDKGTQCQHLIKLTFLGGDVSSELIIFFLRSDAQICIGDYDEDGYR